MSRENSKKYPKSVESKNSFLRIRAPENLDIALEGLIRKVLKEQPKMDDIYAFAADYFDMLLKIREKAGIRKLSPQDICPHHNEDDAHEMVKLASSFTKRTKPHSNTYKALTLRNLDQSEYRKTSEKLESKDLGVTSKEDEISDQAENTCILPAVKENTESEKTKNESTEFEATENEVPYRPAKVSGHEVGEEVFIKANEVVTEYSAEDEDSPRDILANSGEDVGDINELRDKIKAVENEIKLLDNKEKKNENETGDKDVAGEEDLEKDFDKIENVDSNLEESIVERSVEDDKEKSTNLAEEIEAETQEGKETEVAVVNIEHCENANANADNIDESDKKLEGEQDERDISAHTENEEPQNLDIETEMKGVESKTPDVITDDVEKAEETKEVETNAELLGNETQSEVEVKSSGDDSERIKEMSLEEQTENKEIPEDNTTEVAGQDKIFQEKENEVEEEKAEEKEVVGDENLQSKNIESETLVEEEGEEVKVQDSEVAKTGVTEKEDETLRDENPQVHELDTPVSEKTPEEGQQIEKEVSSDPGTDINVTDSVAPILLRSTLNGIEKSVEASAEESPSAEETGLRDGVKNPEVSTATEIEKFLDNEREYSSIEKGSANRELTAPIEENSVESEITSRVVSELGTIKENEEVLVQGEDTSGKVPIITQKSVEFEVDNHEGSTTSGEIEFENSPGKYPETDMFVSDEVSKAETDKAQEDTNAEPEIVFELSHEDQKSEEQAEEYKEEPGKVLLQVPNLLLDENIARKPEGKRGVEPEEEEDEIIPECSNVGNEVIQQGEVEKVELVEGEEDILQVHLTTTIQNEQDPTDSVHVEMVSRIEPTFTVSVETRIESPVQDPGSTENMKLIKAAVIIQNGFRRFKNKKISDEKKVNKEQLNNKDASETNKNVSAELVHTLIDPNEDSSPSFEKEIKTLNLSEARNLHETQSLESVRKISPLKTRSLSSIRYGVADFEVWNQLVKELEEAATKIQSNYRGYKTRKKLQRENAVQSTTTTSEDSTSMPDLETSHRHTGEFHDTVVLPLDPK